MWYEEPMRCIRSPLIKPLGSTKIFLGLTSSSLRMKLNSDSMPIAACFSRGSPDSRPAWSAPSPAAADLLFFLSPPIVRHLLDSSLGKAVRHRRHVAEV